MFPKLTRGFRVTGRSRPTSGASTPRSTHSQSYRSASPTYSSSTIIYHPSSVSPPLSPSLSRSRAQSIASLNSGRPPPTPLLGARKRSRSVRPSLLGAIEFRDVVNSLSSDRSSAANVLAVFGGAHQHHAHSHDALEEVEHEHDENTARTESSSRLEMGLGFGGGREAQGRRRALSQPSRPGALTLGEGDDVLAEGVLREAEERRRGRLSLGGRQASWTGAAGSGDESEDDDARRRSGANGLVDLSGGVDDPWKGARSPMVDADGRAIKRVPSILLTTDSGSDTVLADPPSPVSGIVTARHSRRKHHVLHAIRCALFPSLQSFRSKSILGKCTALLCVPALLVLNLTLPVVEEPGEDTSGSWHEEKYVSTPRSGVQVESRHVDATSSDDEDDEDDSHQRDAYERIGHALHSPAVAHPHGHSDSPSHRLQHVRAEAAEAESPHGAWAEVATPPLAPAAVEAQRPASPMDYFRVVNASEASQVGRVGSAESGDLGDVGEASEEECEWRAQEAVTRGLTALQCALGPVFCVAALLGSSSPRILGTVDVLRVADVFVVQPKISNGGTLSLPSPAGASSPCSPSGTLTARDTQVASSCASSAS